MKAIELIYDTDCPNVSETRNALRKAFAETSQAPVWVEWNRQSPESPAYALQYGSPTILVDGRDVVGVDPGEGLDCCRVYGAGGRLSGVPPLAKIIAALKVDRSTNQG